MTTLSSYGDIAQSAGTEGAKILVFGAVGDKLKAKDKKRMFAVIQQDPSFFLCTIGNVETMAVLDKIIQWASEQDKDITEIDLPEDIRKEISRITEHDSLFLETTEFLHESRDILATGSFATGEFEQKRAVLKTMGEVKE